MSRAEPSPPTGDVTRRSPADGDAARASGMTEALFAGLLIWGLFLALSLVRWPIPGVNEPHYLTKGRHYVDPDWIRRDFFLDSANPHAATSWLLGELSSRMPLASAALVGRVLAFGLLALGFVVMLRQALATSRERWLATGLFLLLHILGNWSGEWLLRGVEGKVFAWGFLFLATGLWSARREWLAGVSLGAALTFHPVIGAWGAISAALSVAWEAIESRGFASQLRRAVVPVILFGLFAAPGILAALPTLRLGTPDERWQADHIQVTQRLAHHLDPGTFAWASHREYLLMLGAIWLLSRSKGQRAGNPDPPFPGDRSFLERMAWSSVLCAAGGIVVSIWPRTLDHFSLYVLRLKLLKLYPFRLADIFVPLLLAVKVVEFPRFAGLTRTSARAFVTFAGLIVLTFLWPGDEGPARRMSLSDYDHWQNVLTWIRDHTPRGVVLQTMNEEFAVKWHAERAEFVAYKDCPQDAPGILEWHRRLTTLDQWRTPAMADLLVTNGELEQLHRLTGIDYLLCSRFGPIEAQPVYASGPFRVYATSSQPAPAEKE